MSHLLNFDSFNCQNQKNLHAVQNFDEIVGFHIDRLSYTLLAVVDDGYIHSSVPLQHTCAMLCTSVRLNTLEN